jgi:hypothetical protein
VVASDVLQRGVYLTLLGSSYVYVRYRCRYCKRVGEYYVQEKDWDPAVLQPVRGGVTKEELDKFKLMGPITPDEVVSFRKALRRFTSFKEEKPGR